MDFFQNKEAADMDRCLFEIMYKILECSNVDQSVPELEDSLLYDIDGVNQDCNQYPLFVSFNILHLG